MTSTSAVASLWPINESVNWSAHWSAADPERLRITLWWCNLLLFHRLKCLKKMKKRWEKKDHKCKKYKSLSLVQPSDTVLHECDFLLVCSKCSTTGFSISHKLHRHTHTHICLPSTVSTIQRMKTTEQTPTSFLGLLLCRWSKIHCKIHSVSATL